MLMVAMRRTFFSVKASLTWLGAQHRPAAVVTESSDFRFYLVH